MEYNRNYFNMQAHSWDKQHINGPSLAVIAYLASVKAGSRVLDIGCGTGVAVSYLLPYKPKTITGVDISEKMIEQAIGKHGGKATFVCCDYYAFQGSGYDVVLVHNAYPHFTNKAGFVSKTSGVLCEGGRFMVAHSVSRETVNSVHKSKRISCLQLADITLEKTFWEKHFTIDMQIQCENLYVLSGLKKRRY